ncbi:protein kinase [Novymonas esmeraldas]|uniref:Protein kinase n=1 Tax=Novymonas esmeraldas TaxID=1808958 RepID=A0AAW0F4R9_9TRYP
MHARREVRYARPSGVDIDVGEATSPTSGGGTASRRIVKSLKTQLACVTQLVPLDNGENGRLPNLLSRFNTASLQSEASVSEVRSELCSVAMEEQTEDSTSSFDHRRSRHGRKVSSSVSRSRASRAGHGSRARMRRSFPSGSSREVEESILSYSADASFYDCDSDASSNSAGTEGSSHSMSYTAISESVPSCSLTGLVENKPAATGWASRFRKPNPPPPPRESNSFGSIFGSGGIDPYNGSSVHAHHGQARDGAATGAAAAAGGGTRAAAAVPQKDVLGVVVSPSSSSVVTGTSYLPPAASASSPLSAPRPSGGASLTTSDSLPVSKAAECASPLNNSVDQRPRVQSVKLLDRVGRGTFGDVYRAEDLDSGNIIAVKEIIVPHDFTKDVEKQLAALESEIRVMRRLHHAHVVTYLGAVREDNSLRIFMEFVGGGTVGNKVESDGGLSEEKTRYYTAQLLEGLEYLHASHILHRDLKGDNLFLTEDDQLKLGDFGQSKELADTLITQSVQGTPSFMSPEMIACSGYSFEADVWSVGCCVIQMLTGKPPFANLDNQMAVMFAIISSKIEDQIPAQVSDGAKDFIRMCTKTNIKDRWTASQLRQHPWLLNKSLSTPTTTTGTALVKTPAAPNAGRVQKAGGVPSPPPLKAKEPTQPNPHLGKHPRSILLDTTALAKAEGSGDEIKKGPSNGSVGYQFSYEDDAGEHEAGGTTSSNLSSSKEETPSSKNAAAAKHTASALLPQPSPRSDGTSSDSMHASPTARQGGRRQPHGPGGGARAAAPAPADALVVVGHDGGGSAGRGRRKSPPEPTPRPHRPAYSPRKGSPRTRPAVAGTAAAPPGESPGKRRSNPSPVTRALNTPVHHLAGGGASSPSKGRSETRPTGSAIHRNSGTGNQTSRTTPNSTSSIGKRRQPVTARGPNHASKEEQKA